jgi:hypothetical protein
MSFMMKRHWLMKHVHFSLGREGNQERLLAAAFLVPRLPMIEFGLDSARSLR